MHLHCLLIRLASMLQVFCSQIPDPGSGFPTCIASPKEEMSGPPSRTNPYPGTSSSTSTSTSTSTSQTAAAPSHSRQVLARLALRSQSHKAPGCDVHLETTTDKSTIALIRRVLCPPAASYNTATPRPLQELLPPLTSSNDVDVQLYAIIAIIIKEFVYAWYTRITPDHVFIDEIIQVIAHCTRALEERLRRIDVEQLLLDEIPCLIEAHILCEFYPSLSVFPLLPSCSSLSGTAWGV
jgi:hypothetical protein